MCETVRVEPADKTPDALRRPAQNGLFPRGRQAGRRAKKDVDGDSFLKPFRRQKAGAEKGAPARRHGQQRPRRLNSSPQEFMPQVKVSCRAGGLQCSGQPPDPGLASKPLVGRPRLTIR